MEPFDDPEEGPKAVGAPVEPKAASVLLRVGAFAIDAALVGAAAWLWMYAVLKTMPTSSPRFTIGGILVLVVAYYGWATARSYHTPGQGYAGLTLARTDYHPLSGGRAFLRALLFMLTSSMFLPNWILMLFDKKRRTIHDWATKTWVYALPGYHPGRRRAAIAAAWILIVIVAARSMLTVCDYLEQKDQLSLQEVAAGADND